MLNFNKILVLGISALALAACGGGSGSSGGGSGSGGGTGGGGTGGGTSNAAPVVNIAVSDNSPNEGLSSTLDASGSSDSDGDTLSFSWTQLSGPSVTFSNASSAETTITVPNLTADMTARIQVSVSDGTVTTTDEVTLTLEDVVQTPLIDDSGLYKNTLSIPAGAIDLFQNDSAFTFESETLIAVPADTEMTLVNITSDNAVFTLGNANLATASQTAVPFGTGYPEVLFGSSYGFMESDKIIFHEYVSTTPLFEIDIASPCGLNGNELSGNGAGINSRRLIVGKAGGGASLFQFITGPSGNIEDSLFLTDFADDRTICHLSQSDDGGLLAFDESANQLVFYSPVFQDGQVADYTETNAVDLDLKLTDGETASLVTGLFVGDLSFSHGLALLFTDGQTEGVHRLVVAHADRLGAISQDTQSWPYGTPTDLAEIQFDQSSSRNRQIMVTASDSPHAIIFDYENQIPLRNRRYLDVGVGAEAVMQYFSLSVAPRIGGPLILDSGSNEVRFIGVRDD